jgi:hypothetical protein
MLLNCLISRQLVDVRSNGNISNLKNETIFDSKRSSWLVQLPLYLLNSTCAKRFHWEQSSAVANFNPGLIFRLGFR